MVLSQNSIANQDFFKNLMQLINKWICLLGAENSRYSTFQNSNTSKQFQFLKLNLKKVYEEHALRVIDRCMLYYTYILIHISWFIVSIDAFVWSCNERKNAWEIQKCFNDVKTVVCVSL